MMGYYDGYGMGYGFGWIFMVFLWVLIIWGVISLIRWLSMGSHGHGEHPMHHTKIGGPWMGDRSMQILNERYAKGEITKEQFEEMKKNLST